MISKIILFTWLSLNSQFLFVLTWHDTINFDFSIRDIDNKHINVFESSYSSRDYFALLSTKKNNLFDLNEKNNSILIGARNNLFELKLPDLSLLNKQTWQSSSIDIVKCLNRSIINNKDECDNYIKLYLKVNENTFKICSTNALNPKCRYYQLKNNSNVMLVVNETSGIGYSPLKAYENKYVYNYVEANRYLYTANAIDLNRFFSSINRFVDQQGRISTNVDDNNWLFRADFVNSFVDNERIFFLFNEDATIDEMSTSENRMIKSRRYSRISHICLNDNGAPLNSLRNIWTTYLKSKLSCVYDTSKSDANSINLADLFKTDPSSHLFYFDEIKSISELYKSMNETYFYAIFTTSSSLITASAICRFHMRQIMSNFNGDYKLNVNRNMKQRLDNMQQEASAYNYQEEVPQPRPSQCPNKLTYQHLIFARKNFNMENEVVSQALVVETSKTNRFASIDVDFKVKSLADENLKSDVLFIGTDDGKILTFVIQDKDKLVYAEELNVFDAVKKNSYAKSNQTSNKYEKIISNLKLFQSKHFVAITQNKVLSVPAHYCYLKNEAKCNNLLQPYCIWSNKLSKCVSTLENLFNMTEEIKHIESIKLTTKIRSLNETSVLTGSTSNLTYKSISLQSSPQSLLNMPNLSTTISYKLVDNEILISINFILFILLAILFSLMLILFIIFISFNIYKRLIRKIEVMNEKAENLNKISSVFDLKNWFRSKIYEISAKKHGQFDVLDSKINISTKHLTSNASSSYRTDSPTYAYQCQPSPFLTSSIASTSTKSYSPTFDSNTKTSSLSNYKASVILDEMNSKYVFGNVKDCQEVTHQISEPCSGGVQNYKFLDYDDTEYFTLSKKNKDAFEINTTVKHQQQQHEVSMPSANTELSDKLTGSSNTLKNLAILMRNHFNLSQNESAIVAESSDKQSTNLPIYQSIDNNNLIKKYYL